MRALWASVLVVALVACGSSHSATSTDAPGSGTDGAGSDGNGGGGGDGSGGPATVKLTLTDRPNNAAMFSFLVAYQDGSGPWTLAPAPTGDTYTLPIHSPVYSVAWTCIGTTAGGTGGATQLRQVSLASFAVAERSSLTMTVPPRCTDRISRVALTGNITGTNGGFYLVTAGDRTVFANNGAYSMELRPGTYDVFALRAGPGSGAGDLVVDQAAVVRGVAVTAASAQDIDFTTAQGTQSFAVTVQNAATARVQATTTLYTANGSSPTLVLDSTSPWETEALAAAQGASGDVYLQAVQVGDAGGATETVESWTGAPAAQDVTPPAAQGGATSTVPTSMPYPEIMTTWAAYSGATGYAWIASQPLGPQQCGGQNACAVVWSALLSPGVTGASPAFQMPDLSGLSGWSSELQLVPGSTVNGRLDAFTSSAGTSDFPPVAPAASGTQRTTAEGRWTVTP